MAFLLILEMDHNIVNAVNDLSNNRSMSSSEVALTFDGNSRNTSLTIAVCHQNILGSTFRSFISLQSFSYLLKF